MENLRNVKEAVWSHVRELNGTHLIHRFFPDRI